MDGDADAGSRRHPAPFKPRESLDDVRDPPRELSGIVAACDVGLQYREFVAAEPREHVRLAHMRLQLLSDQSQESVASGVPEQVGFEAIEIEEVERKQLIAATAPGDQVAQPLLQKGAVRQVRQRIMMRKVVQMRLVLLARGDVERSR